ncbi:MAG: thiol-disulfide oxidoreductase DCC family protein [Thermomicrobiales bacterium]
MIRMSRLLGLAGLGLAGGWGIAAARLHFGATPERVLLIFDGSCDFCTRTVRLLRALDHRKRVTARPFQQPGLPAAHHLTVAQCEHSVWAVTPDGWVFPGAAAANLALAVALGAPLPLWFYTVPGVRQAQERAYRWVAANRHRFPGDTPYCEQFPAECGQIGT